MKNDELRIMNKETGKIRLFTDLNAWKEGHILVLTIYKTTKQFPKEEMFGLISQMRRCSVSITSNIAEGFSRQSYSEKAYFYSIAQGSVTELQNQLFIARDIGYVTIHEFDSVMSQTVTVHKIVSGLIKKSKTIHNGA